MKKLKHFMGWLFNYCPHGNKCTPKKPFTINIQTYGGGGC